MNYETMYYLWSMARGLADCLELRRDRAEKVRNLRPGYATNAIYGRAVLAFTKADRVVGHLEGVLESLPVAISGK